MDKKTNIVSTIFFCLGVVALVFLLNCGPGSVWCSTLSSVAWLGLVAWLIWVLFFVSGAIFQIRIGFTSRKSYQEWFTLVPFLFILPEKVQNWKPQALREAIEISKQNLCRQRIAEARDLAIPPERGNEVLFDASYFPTTQILKEIFEKLLEAWKLAQETEIAKVLETEIRGAFIEILLGCKEMLGREVVVLDIRRESLEKFLAVVDALKKEYEGILFLGEKSAIIQKTAPYEFARMRLGIEWNISLASLAKDQVAQLFDLLDLNVGRQIETMSLSQFIRSLINIVTAMEEIFTERLASLKEASEKTAG